MTGTLTMNPAATVSPARLANALGLPAPTPEQAAVIAAPREPALVVAGAGAGKTETMAARVVWLVANRMVTPERVLGLTFTRKAARQLAERVRNRLRRLAGSGLLTDIDPTGELAVTVLAGEPTILTYHAYAGRLLAEHGLRIPVQPGTRMLTETAAWQLAHRVVSTWDSDLETDRVPTSVTAQVLALAGELGEHLIDVDDLASHTQGLCDLIEGAPRAKGQRNAVPRELLDIIAAQRFRLQLMPLVESYQRRKRAEGALDFADQMSLAARVAESHREVATCERERFGAVLLDEYQDTGHAQRILLRALFGGVENAPLPVTAVGDPAQAIYGWRGASAANLPRFVTDFPRPEHQGRQKHGKLVPAREYGLLTSFRNPPEVLTLANAIAEPLRAGNGLGVGQLRARDNAPPADLVAGLLPDVRAEREWIAEALAKRWHAEVAASDKPPTAAVLVRRRADMAPIAAALRAQGLPVEVVGLGGLLDEPEVADVVSTLRVLADPLAGTAAARLLTGARWRLAAADLGALWRRAKELAGQTTGDAAFAERAEQTGLVDAIDDPGDAANYSTEGFRRIRRFGSELSRLRARLDQTLPELVADVERTMLLDVESLARPSSVGRAHLDAFADVVTDYAEADPSASLLSFVDYLAAASHAEDGLTPGEVEVVPDRVQVLTVHSAKGLEWRIVAVPHLVQDVFPSKRRSSSWLRTVTELPAALRGDSQDLPELRVSAGYDRKEVQAALREHEESFAERHFDEERRLCYVALTRAEHTLLVSGHRWNENSTEPKEPSPFLVEIMQELNGAKENPIGTIDVWAEKPAGEENPLLNATRVTQWPIDPLGARRSAVAEGADLVHQALADPTLAEDGQKVHNSHETRDHTNTEDPDGWIADTDVLLAEWTNPTNQDKEVALPEHLSVSQLVELANDPTELARRIRRPLPMPPNKMARRGTEFHGWLERRFAAERLFDIDDLPGAADIEVTDSNSGDLAALQEAFEASEWANRTPYEVEVPFATEVDGITVRGRMDAVFAEPDGSWLIIDWKTGSIPNSAQLPALSIQLTAYRLAWARLRNIPLENVRAAFHYIRPNHTLWPQDLTPTALPALLQTITPT